MLERYGKVIIINGCPASGKTYTAKLLSNKLNIPIISKDFFKESLFDSLGFKDRQFSIKLGNASYELLLKTARLLAEQKYSFIMENSFFSGSEEHIITALPGQRIIQIWCDAPLSILLERFTKRAANGSRHPGHVDANNIKEVKEKILANTYKPLELPAPLIYLSTADFNSLNYINVCDRALQQYAKL